MAKDKKIDYSKLSLGSKKRTIKKKIETPEKIDEVVRKIHQPNKTATPPPRKKKVPVPTKRVTLDIPIPLHAEIRKKTFDMGITMKKYFLDLAKQHLNEKK